MTVAELICELVTNCNMTDSVELKVPTEEYREYSMADENLQVIKVSDNWVRITVKGAEW